MAERLVVLTDEEIRDLLFAHECVLESDRETERNTPLAANLRAILEQPEGIGEEWRAALGDKGDLLADTCEPRDTREAAQADLDGLSAEADPPYDRGWIEHRYCTPWAALHREDGEG